MTSNPGSGPGVRSLRLADWGVIRASGPDARSFLQAQLTQDVQSLQPGAARLAGYCSPKGRLLATFVVWSPSADEVLLACSADLLPGVLKRLSMYVLRLRCKLSDASGELVIRGHAAAVADGVAAPPVWAVMAEGAGHLIGLPPARTAAGEVGRWLWVGPASGAANAADSLPALEWAGLEVRSGVARIVAATSEQFVPQMVNLELVGGVSFQKGCFPGQEIVARSQYRGTLKRRAYVLECQQLPSPGQEVYLADDPGQPAGMVALAGSLEPGRYCALVELKIAASRAGQLLLASPSGAPLHHTVQPYEIPLEAA